MRFWPSLGASVLLATTPVAAWTRVGSERYGTSVEVPDGYRAQRAPDNGDGRTLVAPDGRASIAVFATQDILHEGLVPPGDVAVTYRAQGAGWLVYSGMRGTRIVYERMMAACADRHLIHHVLIEYVNVDKARMAEVVERAAGSLRGGCTE